MSEDIVAGYKFGTSIADFAGGEKGLADRTALAGSTIDFSTHIIDRTPVGALLSKAVAELDERGVASLERSKIVQEIKQKFAGKISRVVAQKMHASSMVSSSGPLENVHSAQEFMDKSKADYDKNQAGYAHKVKRKMHDKFRADTKSPVKYLMIPLGFIPDGGITTRVVSSLQYLGNKAAGARKGRRQKGYAAGNKAVLEQQMGAREAQRKITKWSAKNIAELGPKLQRNLHKLKQSVALLETREQQVNMKAMNMKAMNNSPGGLEQLSQSHMELAMSFHETKHYIEKVSTMCKVMEDTAFETRAHMLFLDELLEQTEQAIRANASTLYK